jgi:hypothetical protein
MQLGFIAVIILPLAWIIYSIHYFKKLKRIRRTWKVVCGEIIGSSWVDVGQLKQIHVTVRYELNGSLQTTTCTLMRGAHNASPRIGDRMEFFCDPVDPSILYSTKPGENSGRFFVTIIAVFSVFSVVLVWPIMLIMLFT